MASLKHLEKRKAAQLDRIEQKLDLLLKAAGIVVEETQPVVEETPLTGEGEGDTPEGEQPESDKPRSRKKN